MIWLRMVQHVMGEMCWRSISAVIKLSISKQIQYGRYFKASIHISIWILHGLGVVGFKWGNRGVLYENN